MVNSYMRPHYLMPGTSYRSFAFYASLSCSIDPTISSRAGTRNPERHHGWRMKTIEDDDDEDDDGGGA
jgi:hypothetical protein